MTLTTVEGIYKNGVVELTETPAGMEEANVLVTFLPSVPSVEQPKVLYGAWQAAMPADLDVDAILKEIRTDWTQEWEEGKND